MLGMKVLLVVVTLSGAALGRPHDTSTELWRCVSPARYSPGVERGATSFATTSRTSALRVNTPAADRSMREDICVGTVARSNAIRHSSRCRTITITRSWRRAGCAAPQTERSRLLRQPDSRGSTRK